MTTEKAVHANLRRSRPERSTSPRTQWLETLGRAVREGRHRVDPERLARIIVRRYSEQ